jgi:Type IV secretion-system coupling protein DNA-binding domain
MPSDSDNPLTYIARLNFRNDGRLFGIRRRDRRFHTYVIGKTGTGKSTLLEFLIRQDVLRGEGLALLDPHGDLYERVLARIPATRTSETIRFDVPDRAAPLAFNPLERVPPEKRVLAASGLLDVFKTQWADSWGPRVEHILRNALYLLLDQPEATLADVTRLLDDQAFRKRAVLLATNRHVAHFWLREYEGYPARFRAEAIAPLQNKVGAFLSNPLLSRILTQPRSAFDLREVIDGGKILLVNLAKGKIGADTASLLGSLLVSRIGLAALSRADMPESERRDFYLYLDEFPTFTTLSLANMLSELRKYRLNLILAHQFLGQLDEEVRDAILGNVGTIIAFRLGLTDAELLEKEFAPEFSALDLVRLPNHAIYLKLMVEGAVTRAFSGETIQHG